MKQTIRAWRLAKEITVEQIASAAKVHPNTYRGWEKRPEMIPVGKAYEIAAFLNLNIAEIDFCTQTLDKTSNEEA